MKDLHSGLDAWRYIIASDSERRSVDSYLPLILSIVGALSVLPFMVLRYMQGAWVAAIVDTVIVAGFIALGTYVFRTRRVQVASIVISCFCITGVISTVYIVGAQQVYWVYPTLMAVFYLVRPRIALVLAIITVAVLIPQMTEDMEFKTMTTVLVTIAVMSSFAFAFSRITNRQRERLMQLATKDPLTGVGNRRGLDVKLKDIVNNHKRSGMIASMLLLDLDHFKKVNDVHGHAVGDQTLKRVTEIINLRIRVTDSLYRIGGEEFVVEDETASSWLGRADEALYRAKHAGRNTTSIAE